MSYVLYVILQTCETYDINVYMLTRFFACILLFSVTFPLLCKGNHNFVTSKIIEVLKTLISKIYRKNDLFC